MKFTIEFRPMDKANDLVCDYCERAIDVGREVVWYNELLVMGLCDKCMEKIKEYYDKDGGA